jgi:hypothetical protein
MTDTFGATSLPIANVARSGGLPTEPIGDPAMATLLAWARAVLTAEVGPAWADLAPGEPVVRCVHFHDPRAEDFAVQRLPALFAYREAGRFGKADDGRWTEERPTTLLWVYPPGSDDKMPARRGVAVALGRALHEALGPLNGRHPSWVVTGDADPFAAVYGSSLLDHGGFEEIRLDATRTAQVEVADATFEAISLDLICREVWYRAPKLTGSTITTINQGPGGFVQVQGLSTDFTSEFTGDFR